MPGFAEFWSVHDNEMLIYHIRKYEAIFNPKNAHYKDPQIKNNAFTEIAKAMGRTGGSEIQNQWTKLKQKYQRERAKDKAAQASGSPVQESLSHWPHMASMSHFNKFIQTRQRTSNLPKTISSNAKPVDNTPKPPVINEDSSSQYDLADLVAMEYGKPNAVRVILDEEKNSQQSTENGDTSAIGLQLLINDIDQLSDLMTFPSTTLAANQQVSANAQEATISKSNNAKTIVDMGASSTEDSTEIENAQVKPPLRERNCNGPSQESPYSLAKKDVLPPRKKVKSDDELIGKLDGLVSKLAEMPQQQRVYEETKDIVEKKTWINFGTDCGHRLSILPRRLSLKLRQTIEKVLLDAEMDAENII